MAKIKQSETVFINRSQINFAAYNPRKQNPKVVEALKRNFRKVGFLGGIQWNSTTGNLIGGHKRTEALDLIYGYDGSIETDYEIKVEQIELDEKTEKEQNIFLNNKRAQGETDYIKLAEILPCIDVEEAALTEYDIEMVETLVPNFKMGSNDEIKKDIENLKPQKTEEEKTAHVKGIKEAMKQNHGEAHLATHFTVTFKTYDEKAEYLESIGINGDDIFITFEKFIKRLNE